MKQVIIVLILLLGLTFYITHKIVSDITEIEDTYKSKLGKYYITKTDTLKIVNYSMFKECVILEDGTKININLIEDE